MALDFLSSDIVFPSDSSEPKLATGAVTKLPEPVDWAFHDYYSTACEKNTMPVHSLADYAPLDPVKDNDHDLHTTPSTLAASKSNQVGVPGNEGGATSATSAVVPVPPSDEDHQKYMRAILCGALETVNNAMQDNHLTRLDKHTSTASANVNSSNNNNTATLLDKGWRWEDDVLFGTLAPSPLPESFLPPPSPLTPVSENMQYQPHHLDIPSIPSPDYRTIDDDELVLDNTSGLTSLITSPIDFNMLPPPESPNSSFYPSLPASPIVPEIPSSPISPMAPATPVPTSAPAATITNPSTPISQPMREGKPSIAKSKGWQNLVGRLKKNLATSSLAPNKKQKTPSTSESNTSKKDDRTSRILKRLWFVKKAQ
ncbi:hypothetical protein O0I10_003590 [Lichtheimia ornata]|uniref:Uncharacterized protein n=1 Tax=Lichtheimia ornata TaxID=688661 RepID=A0AAD7XXB1_9FUNG|nr:uncharacterized protein O0I10_003590 [Lichtheimia ornata]KAJ8660544.1 hypothetical protein O0I10_003590 [Lichtheimia ornata]